MEAEIRDAVTNAAPTTAWVLEDEQSQSGCRDPFSNLGGRTVILASCGAPTPILDDVWPAALAAAATIARRNGFTNTQVKVDNASNHQVRVTNPTDGSYTDLGTRKAVVLLTSTGCHLPAGSRSTGQSSLRSRCGLRSLLATSTPPTPSRCSPPGSPAPGRTAWRTTTST